MTPNLVQFNVRLPDNIAAEINNLADELAEELGLPRLTQADVVCLAIKRLRLGYPPKKNRKKKPESP